MGRIGTIINRKGKQDAKKAKIFTKHARNITVAAREGGGDPEYNASLATAIDKAKADNMPNDNIDKAIKKGTGEADGTEYTELRYEGYGPGGSAFIVECLTDNTNRTAANVRSYFTKVGGSLGKTGEVSFMFDRKGVLVVEKLDKDNETIEMDIIEAGADDFEEDQFYYEIYTELEDFANVRNSLKKKGYQFKMAELRYLPQSMIQISGDDNIKAMNKLIDLFDDDDDVQNIYYNCEE